MSWTADQLLADVKRKANLPPGTNAKLSDAQMLRIADEVILTQVDPALTTLQEEYDVTSVDIALAPNIGTYALPGRAVSGTIVQVLMLDQAQRPTPLERIGGSELWRFEGPTALAQQPVAYALVGSTIRALPTPTASGYGLRVRYRRRPSDLVLTTQCARVTGMTSTTLVTTGGTWGATAFVDVVRATPPVDVLVQGVTASQAGGTFTFGAGVLDNAGVAIGDYVCVAGTSCVVPLPERFSRLAVGLVAAQVLDEWGATDDATSIRATISTYVDTLLTAQSNRAAAQPLMSINGGDGLLGGMFGWRRR